MSNYVVVFHFATLNLIERERQERINDKMKMDG